MAGSPIVLVPGFWLGAWAWDEVAEQLREDGHRVRALTLPGLESVDADRASVTIEDHISAICAAVSNAGPPVVLAVHSGAAVPGYRVTDRMPELIAAMVYVDTAPGNGPLNPGFAEVEYPLPATWEELESDGNSLAGINDAQLEEFRRRAVPQPGAALREGPPLTNEARLEIPTTMICTGNTSQEYQDGIAEGYTWLNGLNDLRDITWIDLPTSHWPMWSRPQETASIIGGVATQIG